VSPGLTATTLTWILGIWLIMRGVFESVAAFTDRRVVPRWMLVLTGTLSILLGVLFGLNPGAGAVSIAVALGATALLWGVTFIGTGLSVRRTLRAGEAQEHCPATRARSSQ
jgi:uncharacterized membrane protein HdeD (DUF308 family)